jgi:hypothetical protein
VGKSVEGSAFPSTTEVENIEARIASVLADYSGNENNSVLSSISAYIKLLKIHPFSDANGRVFRAFQIAEDNRFGEQLPPILYRYQKGANDLYIHDMFLYDKNVSDLESHLKFWNKAYGWAENKTKVVQKLIEEAHCQIQSKLTVLNLSQVAIALLRVLWQQPIVNSTLLQSISNDEEEVTNAVIQLVQAKVLLPTQLGQKNSDPVFHCEILINLYKHIESAIFQP